MKQRRWHGNVVYLQSAYMDPNLERLLKPPELQYQDVHRPGKEVPVFFP
jgi:hypothetical protein